MAVERYIFNNYDKKLSHDDARQLLESASGFKVNHSTPGTMHFLVEAEKSDVDAFLAQHTKWSANPDRKIKVPDTRHKIGRKPTLG